jgi:drug/metabolite transporter (DMT)-like permease
LNLLQQFVFYWCCNASFWNGLCSFEFSTNFLTTFGALFLNEKVRWRRWTAVIFGFIGVVVVINPTKLEFGFYFIFPLLSAILLSFRDMYTKNIKGNFHSLQIAFITCLVVTIFFGFLSIYKFYYFSIKDYLILFVSSFFSHLVTYFQ